MMSESRGCHFLAVPGTRGGFLPGKFEQALFCLAANSGK